MPIVVRPRRVGLKGGQDLRPGALAERSSRRRGGGAAHRRQQPGQRAHARVLAADSHGSRDRALKLRASKMWGQRPQDVRAERRERLVERVEHPLRRQGGKFQGKDTEDRRRYLNSRATMETLLGLGVVPIVNENDTVATDEIRFGDNDRLAAQIAVTAGADQLVLLSDVDGLYTANPKEDATATRFDVVETITPEIEAMAGDPVSGMSKGGMKTKLLAAKTAVAGGCAMAIMEGSVLRPLKALAEGANRTWFVPAADPQVARKRWINAMKPKGDLVLDAGAVTALRAGKSLLPAGVTKVVGSFGRGEPVAILSPEGVVLGKGLVRYTSAEARKIAGHRSGEIETILGYQGRAALVHRDDMVV